jgi:hypothetical protein
VVFGSGPGLLELDGGHPEQDQGDQDPGHGPEAGRQPGQHPNRGRHQPPAATLDPVAVAPHDLGEAEHHPDDGQPPQTLADPGTQPAQVAAQQGVGAQGGGRGQREIGQQQISGRHPELGHHIGPAHTPRPANPNATRPINPTFSPNKVEPKSGSRALKASRAGSSYCSSKPGAVRHPWRCNTNVGPSCQANNNPNATIAPPSRPAA